MARGRPEWRKILLEARFEEEQQEEEEDEEKEDEKEEETKKKLNLTYAHTL